MIRQKTKLKANLLPRQTYDQLDLRRNLLCRVFELPELDLEPIKEPVARKYSLEWFYDRTHLTDTGCLVWTERVHPVSGYACVSINAKQLYVHRLLAMVFKVHNPEVRRRYLRRNIWVCHLCDNPPCINLDHLVIATPKFNTWDSIVKRRRRSQKRIDLEDYTTQILQV